ncbi:uncharacterized protein LOC123693248 [Colias croceus]|uniref:uncharacterized protein LOC123693248 n=1 Tax=Colias crocea TaxID=72248 RepID=UPI001E281463|nr:uncharacterized protein LOC123693248 [Colias croceus]
MTLSTTIIPENFSSFEALAETAAHIAIHNFRWQYQSLILFNTTLICGVNAFIGSYNKSVIIGQSTFNPWFIENTKQFVLFLDNIDALIIMLEWLKSQRFNNTGKYLVICNSAEVYNCDENRAVSLFWQYQIANIIFMKHKSQQAYGFTYFQDVSCLNSPPIILNKWDTCFQNRNEESCSDIFPLKFTNLHKCPLIVSTFEQEPYMTIKNGIPGGADGDLLRVIIKALNANLIVMTPRIGTGWGKLEENGTWSGSLADIYNDWANFSMTSASLTLRRYMHFQISTSYNSITLAWVTHPSTLEPASLKLMRPYNAQARRGLLFLLLLVCIIAMIFKILKVKLNMPDIPDNILFHSWEICMGLPATRLPTKWVLSGCTILWMLYCYLIRTLYQVYLINCLQTDFRLQDLETIEDAIDAGYHFGGGLALKDLFIEYPLIYDNWENVESSNIQSTLLKLSNGLKFVLAMDYETARMFLRKPNRKLYILPHKIVNGPAVIFFKKYSWLAQSIDAILTRLIESGLCDKIYKDNTFIKIIDDSDAAKVINIDAFKGCYLILLCGWIMASVALVIEKYIYSRKKVIPKSINANP